MSVSFLWTLNVQGLLFCVRKNGLKLFYTVKIFISLTFSGSIFTPSTIYVLIFEISILDFLFSQFLPLFPRQSMHFARGNCGHLKAKWDTHLSCLTCNSCTRISPCYICSSWTEKVWNLAERRRLHATRKSVMTQKRKQKKSKKSKKSQSDMSDNGTVDGSTAPHSFTARGRTHQGGSLADLESDRALSPPVTSQPVTSHQSTSHQSTSHWATYLRSSSRQSTSHQSTSHQSTRHQSTRLQSTRHGFTVIRV